MGTVHKFRRYPELIEITALTMEEVAKACLPVQKLSDLIMRVTLIPDLDKKELEILSSCRRVSLNTSERLVQALSLCLKGILDKRKFRHHY